MNTPLPQSRVRVQRIAEAAVERARLTVVPRVRARTPRVPFVIMVSALLVAGVVGLLMFNTTMQQNSFTSTDLEKQAGQLAAEREGLQMELDALNAPQRIAQRATELGMVQGPAPAFIDLRQGKVTGGAATPADGADSFSIEPPAVQKPKELSPEPTIEYVDPPARERRNRDTARSSADEQSATGRNETETNRRGDRSNR
ncbi:hypothetical protein NODU109028_21395 [Nocardioides dubius]|uniref:Cell division protein FtsL n=1 Tax=Nocardioides dubius TaxID=317019 RepID=A0ABP4EB41_9ACTN